jgi:hypothetical protein
VLTLKRFGATTLLVASIAMPATAAAQGQDLRSPDRQFRAAPHARVKLGRHVRFIRTHVEAAIFDAEKRSSGVAQLLP